MMFWDDQGYERQLNPEVQNLQIWERRGWLDPSLGVT